MTKRLMNLLPIINMRFTFRAEGSPLGKLSPSSSYCTELGRVAEHPISACPFAFVKRCLFTLVKGVPERLGAEPEPYGSGRPASRKLAFSAERLCCKLV